MTRTQKIALMIIWKIALMPGGVALAAGAHRPATLGRSISRPTQFPQPVLIPINTNHDLCNQSLSAAPYRFSTLGELGLDHTQLYLAPIKPRWIEPPRNLSQFTNGYDWRQNEER
jgi:hypothetical protein